MSEAKNYKRAIPINDIDYEMQKVRSDWAEPLTSDDIDEMLEIVLTETDQEKVTRNMWAIMGYYKTALRLGFLTEWNGEYNRVVYDLQSAGQDLIRNRPISFVACIQRVADRIELSHSKGGQFRRLDKTQKHEYTEEVRKEKKPNFLSGVIGKGKEE